MTRVERFYALLLRKPAWVLLCYALVIGVALMQLPKLRLDASSDSLLLQGDPDLAYFRESAEKYGRRVSHPDLGARCAAAVSRLAGATGGNGR